MNTQKKRWSKWEDERLVDLKYGQRTSLLEISRLLNRTERAISARLTFLKKNETTK